METEVTVELEVVIKCRNFISDDTSLKQFKSKAKEEALEYATRALLKDPMVKSYSVKDVVLNTILK